MERLQKILSQAGVASRRASEQMMLEGRVTVNGATVRELGTKADPARDDIRVDGSRVKIADAKFLNDLCTGPDGAIYTTDSFANRVWVIRNGAASLFSDAPQLQLPNGILVDGNKVVVATDGTAGRGGAGTPGSLFAIDIATKAITQITTQSIGTPDGLESDGRAEFRAYLRGA